MDYLPYLSEPHPIYDILGVEPYEFCRWVYQENSHLYISCIIGCVLMYRPSPKQDSDYLRFEQDMDLKDKDLEWLRNKVKEFFRLESLPEMKIWGSRFQKRHDSMIGFSEETLLRSN